MDTYTTRIAFVFLLFWKTSFCLGQDTLPPVITIAARDTTFECGVTTDIIDMLTSWYNNHGGAQFTDNSGNYSVNANLTLSQVITIFSNSLDIMCGNTQKVEVIFTAVDAAGNVSLPSTGIFSTKDMTPPTINSVPNVPYFCIQRTRCMRGIWMCERVG